MALFGRGVKSRAIGELLIAVGILFTGLTWMSDAVKPYQDSPVFVRAITLLGANPFLGILVGFAVTCIMQSSSASIGVLQALAMDGMITGNIAVYICLGACIGSCTTALISSVGSTNNGKRVAVINLLFNVIGVIIFGILISIVFMAVPELAEMKMNAVKIAVFHSSFKLVNAIVLFPMGNMLVKLANRIVRDKPEPGEEEMDEMALRLDERLLQSPSFAIEMTVGEVVEMGRRAGENVQNALDALIHYDYSRLGSVFAREKEINRYQDALTEYLVRISNLSLSSSQNTMVKNLLYAISDIERVGDHAENIAEYAEKMKEEDIRFSEMAVKELTEMSQIVMRNYDWSLQAVASGNKGMIQDITDYEEVVDAMELELRDRHVERLSRGDCRVESGAIFLDIISNLERIADHAMNIVEYVQDFN